MREYDLIADWYGTDRGRTAGVAEALALIASLPVGSRILDIGCGNGVPVKGARHAPRGPREPARLPESFALARETGVPDTREFDARQLGRPLRQAGCKARSDQQNDPEGTPFEAAAEDVAAALTRERMRFALIESRHIQDLMVSSYAAPILLTGPGAADTAEFLRATNKISRSKLGRPTFALENHPDLGMFVRYLGIWERPA